MVEERLTVTDARAARVLIDKRERRFLEPFLKGPRSLSEAARELGVKLPRLSYQVKRLMALGLLRIAGKETRQGREVAVYGAIAPSFFVPFELTSSAGMDALLDEIDAPYYRRFHKDAADSFAKVTTGLWGLRFGLDRQGDHELALRPAVGQELTAEEVFGASFPAVWLAGTELRLDFATAKALQRELHALQERYTAKSTPTGQPTCSGSA